MISDFLVVVVVALIRNMCNYTTLMQCTFHKHELIPWDGVILLLSHTILVRRSYGTEGTAKISRRSLYPTKWSRVCAMSIRG